MHSLTLPHIQLDIIEHTLQEAYMTEHGVTVTPLMHINCEAAKDARIRTAPLLLYHSTLNRSFEQLITLATTRARYSAHFRYMLPHMRSTLTLLQRVHFRALSWHYLRAHIHTATDSGLIRHHLTLTHTYTCTYRPCCVYTQTFRSWHMHCTRHLSVSSSPSLSPSFTHSATHPSTGVST
jgi:hypothetical protein